jgi:hypothetical protein
VTVIVSARDWIGTTAAAIAAASGSNLVNASMDVFHSLDGGRMPL